MNPRADLERFRLLARQVDNRRGVRRNDDMESERLSFDRPATFSDSVWGKVSRSSMPNPPRRDAVGSRSFDTLVLLARVLPLCDAANLLLHPVHSD